MQISTHTKALQTDELSRFFGDKCALNAINLSIPAQGITALLGANGAGKTTLINCALGLCQPSSGSLSILGGRPGQLETKQQLGVMLQDADLPDLLSAREHIELFRSYYPYALRTDEVIKQCDLTEFADKRYKQLSGGQKRRVQFALAILGRPKLVFLDEPTTGLDIDARRVLWNTIRELRDNGTVIVLTTHYLEEADALADHIVVIGEGTILAEGPTADIRAAVSGSVIRLESALDIGAVKTMPGVQFVNQVGRFLEITSDDGNATLIALLQADPQLSELTVQKPRLEDAFTRLNNSQTPDSSKGEV